MSASMEMPAKIRLMYYLWKKKGHKGSKRELAEKLGYEDETTVMKHLKTLEEEGYVKEKMSKNERTICLTNKGRHKIAFLTYQSLAVPIVIIFGLAYIYLGISLYMGAEPVPLSYTVSGAILVAVGILLYHFNKKMEKELFP